MVDLNYNFECDWPIELSNDKLSDNNSASELVENTGSKGGAVVRALASHQCVPGSIPEPCVIRGLSLLLVLALAPKVFFRVLRFPSLLKNQHF